MFFSQRRVRIGSVDGPRDGVACRVPTRFTPCRWIGEAGRIEPLQESMRGVGIRIANRVGAKAPEGEGTGRVL